MKKNNILGLTNTLLLFLIGCTSVKYTAPMVIVMPQGSFTLTTEPIGQIEYEDR
jgi:hypothetical protein